MSYQTYVIIAMCALCASLVAARPQKREAPVPTLALNDAINRTICPIRVRTNTVEGRTPKHIKLIECDDRASKECPANQSENCCNHIGETRRQCYQLEEYIPVKYMDNEIKTFKAQVGCVCMAVSGSIPQEVS